MTDDDQKRKGMWAWGIPASFTIHAVIALIILVGIPFDLPKPEAEETVSVEIVPPPEPAETQKAKAEEPAEPEETERAQKEAAPAPGAKAAEQAEQQPPAPPAVEKPQEQAQQPPPPEAPAEPEQSSPAPPPENFRPVFQFGEKDAGPKRAEQGESDRDEAATQPSESDIGNAADEAAAQPGSSAADAAAQEKPQDNDRNGPAGASVPEIAVPEVGLGASAADAVGTPMPATDKPAVSAEIAATTGKKTVDQSSQTENGTDAAKPAGLKQAKRLYSSHAVDNPFVMEAMKQMSRSERAGALCNTELGEQLVRGSPAYHPRDLPKPRLEKGDVIDVQTAFSADGRWYDVSLRCEVDKGATKVVSFAYRVGKAIPKSEWRKRGFPAY